MMSFHAAQHAAYCAAVTRLIATPERVPSYRAFKGSKKPSELISSLLTLFLGDETTLDLLLDSLPLNLRDAFAVHLIKLLSLLPGTQNLPALDGLVSKKVPFIPNRLDPLNEEDLDTGCSTFQLPYLISLLKREIKQLKEETISALNNSRFYRVVANIPFFNQATTYSQTLLLCDQLLSALDKQSIETLKNLANSKQCPEAIRKLVMQYMFYHSHPDKKPMAMKEWDKRAQEITKQGESQSSFIRYNRLKGLGRGLMARALFEEIDLNNSNFSKDPDSIRL